MYPSSMNQTSTLKNTLSKHCTSFLNCRRSQLQKAICLGQSVSNSSYTTLMRYGSKFSNFVARTIDHCDVFNWAEIFLIDVDWFVWEAVLNSSNFSGVKTFQRRLCFKFCTEPVCSKFVITHKMVDLLGIGTLGYCSANFDIHFAYDFEELYCLIMNTLCYIVTIVAKIKNSAKTIIDCTLHKHR